MARRAMPPRELALLLAGVLLSVSLSGCLQAVDTDHDGALDVDDTDDDNDGVPDDFETLSGANPLDPSDAANDTDGDGLTLLQEFHNGTSPRSNDTDLDGMPDGWEVQWRLAPTDPTDATGDADGDHLTNVAEFRAGTLPRTADTDEDEMADGWEVEHGLNPKDPSDAPLDPDHDLLTNAGEALWDTDPLSNDTDGDHMDDGWEAHYSLNPRVAADAGLDTDGDSFDINMDGVIDGSELYTNLREYENGTDPKAVDSDGDGMGDGFEVGFGLDATNPGDAGADPDNDSLTNLQEYVWGTSPHQQDSDGDGMPDGWEARYAFDPADGTDAAFDRDGDGLSNALEFVRHADPNETDTDHDGTLDGADIDPSVDVVLRLTLAEFSIALATAGVEGAFDPPWEILLRVSWGNSSPQEGQFLLNGTTNTTGSATGDLLNFTFDVNDSVWLAVFYVEVWELDLVETVGVNADDLLDVDPSGANETLELTFNFTDLSPGGESGGGTANGADDLRPGESDARIRISIAFV